MGSVFNGFYQLDSRSKQLKKAAFVVFLAGKQMIVYLERRLMLC